MQLTTKAVRTIGDASTSELVAGAVVLAIAVSFFVSWLAMLAAGSAMSYREWGFAPPGYWETFFGLWFVAYVGGAWHRNMSGGRK